MLYVLDEPSIGLHQRDNDRLLTTLKNLRDAGNTVIVVEHDEEAIREADYVIDIGPGRGRARRARSSPRHAGGDRGGCRRRITGQYLTGARAIPVPTERRKGNGKKVTVVEAPPATTCKDVTAEFPLGHVHLRHRRVGRRQVDADHRDAVQDRRRCG